jgi:hypothetical protein
MAHLFATLLELNSKLEAFHHFTAVTPGWN